MTESLKRSLGRRRSKGRNLGTKEAVYCMTSGDTVSRVREICARARERAGSQKGGKGLVWESEGGAALPHTYTSDNKKGSIRRWVGGNINRDGETVLEGERQAGPEK